MNWCELNWCDEMMMSVVVGCDVCVFDESWCVWVDGVFDEVVCGWDDVCVCDGVVVCEVVCVWVVWKWCDDVWGDDDGDDDG